MSGLGKKKMLRSILPPGAKKAWETNLIEQLADDLPLAKDSVTVYTKPYEIKTVSVKFAD
jgi:hypothetical protein